MDNKLYFENDRGKALMLLGGTGPIRISALSGFGNPEKTYSAVTFAGKAGQKTTGAVAKARTMVISGDILGDRKKAEYMLKILDEPGLLTLDFKNKKREIYCNQTDISLGARKGGYTSFVLTLVADEVYFTDTYETKTAVFQRENMLHGDIVFPCVFTRKNTEAITENFGEINVEPVIYIYNFADDPDRGGSGIVVENITTGQKIALETGMTKNECITIDIKNRKVTSSVKGDILHLISDDTFLSKFWLKSGKNHLRAHHGNTGEDISVILSYRSNYREGIS